MTATNETKAPQQGQKVRLFNYTSKKWDKIEEIDECVGRDRGNSWYIWLKSGRAISIEPNTTPDAMWREVNLSED